MIYRVYTYLRDGMNKTWMSLKLQQSEIATLRSQMSQIGGDGASQGYNCSHCKSVLHGGGRSAYPWKDKTAAEAKRGEVSFMLRMTEGPVAPVIP